MERVKGIEPSLLAYPSPLSRGVICELFAAKHIRYTASQAIQNLLHRLQRHILLAQLQPLQCRIADAQLAGELLQSEAPAFPAKKSTELLGQALSYGRILA
jgi:hypothetical protein